jgi:hypothetical protein
MINIDPNMLTDIGASFTTFYDAFNKRCKLVYESREQPCNNCIIDTKTGESTNQYNGTGPVPFSGGECPVCDGTGRLPNTNQFIMINLYLDWDIRRWMNSWGARVTPDLQRDQILRVPGGVVTGIGKMADLPNVLTCSYCIMDVDSADGTDDRFKLSGAPLDSRIITPHLFFTSFWERLQ